MGEYEKLSDLINRRGCLGERTLSDGTRLIGHVPHIAPEAWLHIVFPGLQSAGLAEIAQRIKLRLPDSLRHFLSWSNGICLFSDHLALYGLRRGFDRTGDAVWQPFSMETPNTLERPRNARKDLVFIGGYKWDGSLLYIDPITNKVFRCQRRSATPLNEWSDLSLMLYEEACRLDSMFDDTGRQINPNSPTIPDQGS